LPIALADLRGKVVALAFIYTGCPDICPMLTQKMVDVQDALGADFGAKVAFVSITLDPKRDTPEVLKDYAQFWGAKPEGWSFLTGSLEAVRDVTRRYGVFFSKKEDGSVEHSQLTTLIDADGQMRVQYLGARFDPEEFRHDLMSLVDKE
jgi:protein SCO1/2